MAKPTINEKKIGYDWGSFTGISLNKDRGILVELSRP
jgi:hypothetical protein